MSDAEESERIERDRKAWNLPVPAPEDVRYPPAESWPPRPFAAEEGARGGRRLVSRKTGPGQQLSPPASGG